MNIEDLIPNEPKQKRSKARYKEILDTVENIIATGKEANVFRAKTLDGRNRAVKIYRLNTATFRKLEKYIDGDPRFRNSGNNPRERVFTWAQKEYKNLHSMKASGAIVPEPFHVHKNIVVMQYIGWRYRPYPTIKDLIPEKPKEFLKLLLESIYSYKKSIHDISNK